MSKRPDVQPAVEQPSNGGSDLVKFGVTLGSRQVQGDQAVYPNSILFRAGEHKEKQFPITGEELGERMARFSGIKGNIEHTNFLRGRAATIQSAWMDDDGVTVRGQVAVPLALDELLTEDEKKVSLEFSRKDKNPFAFALTTKPHVKDAVLMAAFSEAYPDDPEVAEFAKKHNTREGQGVMQAVHDLTARSGAKCSAGTAEMSSGHELSAMQQMHDISTEHGAKCSQMKEGDRAYPVYYSEDPAAAPTGQTAGESSEAGHSGQNPQHTLGVGAPASGGKSTVAKFCETVARWLGQGAPDEFDPNAESPGGSNGAAATASESRTGQATAAAATMSKQPAPEVTALMAQVARLEADKRESQAAAFADEQIRNGHAYPAEREAVIAAFCQAAEDDNRNAATVTFGEGKTGSRVDTLKAIYGARTPHGLDSETLRLAVPEEAQVLFNKQTTPDGNPENETPLTDAEYEKIMNSTPLGQAVLKATRNGNSEKGSK